MRTVRMMFLAVIACGTAQSAMAQNLVDGFFRGAGQGDVAFSWTVEEGDEFWMGQDRVLGHPLGELSTESFNLFFAYGVSDRLEIAGSVPWIESHSKGRGLEEASFQDLEICLKVKGLEMSVGGGSVSLIGAVGLSSPLSSYTVESPVSVGHGSTNVEAATILHWEPRPGFFAEGYLGYTVKSGEVPDSVTSSVKMGFWRDRFYADIWLQQIDARGGYDLGQGPFEGTGVDRTRAGLTGFYRFTPTLGGVVGFADTLDGRNVADYRSYTVGLVFSVR